MTCAMRTKRGAPLSKVVLAIALGVGWHAMAHAHVGYHLSSGGTTGHAAAPASPPARYEPENGRGVGGEACAALTGRAVYDLMALCHENGWRLEPYGDDRYVVTTPRSAAAERSDGGGDDEDEGEGGVSGGLSSRRAPQLPPPARRFTATPSPPTFAHTTNSTSCSCSHLAAWTAPLIYCTPALTRPYSSRCSE